jgi:hypothetical protein
MGCVSSLAYSISTLHVRRLLCETAGSRESEDTMSVFRLEDGGHFINGVSNLEDAALFIWTEFRKACCSYKFVTR